MVMKIITAVGSGGQEVGLIKKENEDIFWGGSIS